MAIFTPREQSLLNRVMDRLSILAGVPAGWPFKWGDKFSDATSSNTDLYVETTGNDNNPGTASSPFATVQAALDSLPKVVRHQVNVNVGVGTFAPFIVTGFTIEPTSGGSWLQVKGTLVDLVPTTGTARGTATSGTAGTGGAVFGTLVDSTQNWVVDEFKGKFIEILSGTGFGTNNIYPILSNTSNTITVVSYWTAPTTSTTYALRTTGTLVNTRARWGPLSLTPGTASTGSYGIACVSNLCGNTATGSHIVLDRLAVETSSGVNGYNFYLIDSDTVAIRFCRGIGESFGVLQVGDSTQANVTKSYFEQTVSTNTNVSLGGNSSSLIFNTSYIKGGLSGIQGTTGLSLSMFSDAVECASGKTGITIQGTAFTNIQNMAIIGLGGSTGISLGSPSFFSAPSRMFLQNLLDISSCGTAVAVQAGNQVGLTSVTGTGNTIGISLVAGAVVRAAASVTLTGTTEVSIDGVSSDLATMRAATPKVIRDANYGTMIYE